LNKRKPQQPASPRRGFWEARHGAGNIVGNPKSRPLKKTLSRACRQRLRTKKLFKTFFNGTPEKTPPKAIFL
jgi:hypothetical protein